MLNKLKNWDINYLATVVEIGKLKPHPNADRLEIFEIYGGNVVVGKGQYKSGDLVVYFPIETKLSGEFLHWANLFDTPELNADTNIKGLFGGQQRVKPVKLRQIPSEGFVFPVSELAKFFNVSAKVFKVGKSFDAVGDKVLLEKWVPNVKSARSNVRQGNLPKWVQILPRPIRKLVAHHLYNKKDSGISSLIVDGQFKYHYSTPQLGRTMFLINPDDEITISHKWHGTSAIYSRVLCHKRKTLWRKLLPSRNEIIKEYRNIYSSRSIIKNRENGEYTADVWGKWAREVFDNNKVEDGMTIFCELIGYVSHSKMIQKSYDYGFPVNENGMVVYRMTNTDSDGNVRELSFAEIQEYCRKHDLKTVPVLYQGIAMELFPEILVDNDWKINFLHKLSETYLEKDCQYCNNKVPSEGIVLRVESNNNKPALKLKSFRFTLKESESRDKGESDIEAEA